MSLPRVRGDGHIEHHAETYDDMSLKKDKNWINTPAAKILDDDKYRGTAFHWSAAGIMWIQMLPLSVPSLALMGFNPF